MRKKNEHKPLTVKEIVFGAKEMMKSVARADDEVLNLLNQFERNASSIRTTAADEELVYSNFDIHVDCVHGSNEGYYADIVLDGRWMPSQKAGTRERMEIYSVRTMDDSMSGCMKAAQYAACLAFFVQKFIDSNMDRFAASNDNFVDARYVSIWDGGRTPNAPPSVSLTCSSMKLSLSPPAKPWTQRKWKSSTPSASSFPMPMRTTGGGFTPSMCEAKSLPRRRQTETHTSFETNFSTQTGGAEAPPAFRKISVLEKRRGQGKTTLRSKGP